MTRHVLLDTSFLIALENRSDPHHQRAKDLDRELFDQRAVLRLSEKCQPTRAWPGS